MRDREGEIGKAVRRVADRHRNDPVRRAHAQLLAPLEHQAGRDAILAGLAEMPYLRATPETDALSREASSMMRRRSTSE